MKFWTVLLVVYFRVIHGIEAPISIVSSVVNSTSIKVTWSAAPSNPQVEKFILRTDVNGTIDSSLKRTLENTQKEYVYTSLSTGSTYKFVVLSSTGEALSLWTDPIVLSSYETSYETGFVCDQTCHIISIVFGALAFLALIFCVVIPVKKRREKRRVFAEEPSNWHSVYQSTGTATEGKQTASLSTTQQKLKASKVADSSEVPKVSEELQKKIRRAEKRIASIKKEKSPAKKDDAIRENQGSAVSDLGYLEFIRQLMDGVVVIRYTQSSARRVKCKVKLSEDLKKIQWQNVGAMGKMQQLRSAMIRTAAVSSIQTGMTSDTFRKRGDPKKEHLYLSLVTRDNVSLDIEVQDKEQHRRFLDGFRTLTTEIK